MKTRFLFAAIAAIATTTAFADDSTLDRADKSFLKDAYEDGLAEIHLGEMTKASASAEVKEFGAHLVAEHTKLNAELKTLADSKKLELPADRTTVAKGKAKLIESKMGADFNKAIVKAAVNDHQESLKDFEKASAEAKDADVKAFAAKTVPALKEHLAKAEALQAKTGK